MKDGPGISFIYLSSCLIIYIVNKSYQPNDNEWITTIYYTF